MKQLFEPEYLNISIAMNQLSPQEKRIAHLISNGFIAKQIADRLCISVFTVNTHLRNIREKTSANNIADITRIYILSLPRPSDVLKTILFLLIHASIVFTSTDVDVRRVRRSSRGRYEISNVIK